jgi:hypothetical protein
MFMASKLCDQPDKPAGDTKPIRKIGRPTNYRPEFCQRVVDLGNQGYSQAMIIADIGAGSRQTISQWMKAHREFSDAMVRARDLALAWWERKGLENANNRDFNSNLYRIIMMARFGQDGYREKQVIETVQGASGVDLRLLSPEERETLAALLTKAKVQTPPAASPAEAVPAETKPETQVSRRAVH